MPDKISPPIPHKVECFEPTHSGASVQSGLDGTSPTLSNAARLRGKTNCTIQLSWVQPFSGAVENPLVDRSADVHGNDIINYNVTHQVHFVSHDNSRRHDRIM